MTRVTVSLENVEKNMEELKADMIPNGKDRVKQVEKDIRILLKFRNGLAAVGVAVIALLPFSDKITNVIGKL